MRPLALVTGVARRAVSVRGEFSSDMGPILGLSVSAGLGKAAAETGRGRESRRVNDFRTGASAGGRAEWRYPEADLLFIDCPEVST
jgi:hypothetical protein